MSAIPDLPLFSGPFIYLRHGETESNAAALIAGSWDVALTRKGLAQAGQAALRLRGAGVTGIYASTLQRSRDTAIIVARELALPVTAIAELNERNWGDLEGQPRASRVPGSTPEGAEPPVAFMTRALRGLALIDTAVPLIVAHSGIYRVLCRTLMLPEPQEPIGNCTPLRFVPPAPGFSAWRVEPIER
jgi:2,3-bisphosphoglycerate-dependent phosphoglycerate mutase